MTTRLASLLVLGTCLWGCLTVPRHSHPKVTELEERISELEMDFGLESSSPDNEWICEPVPKRNGFWVCKEEQ